MRRIDGAPPAGATALGVAVAALLLASCAQVAPDARSVARADHARQAEAPPPPPPPPAKYVHEGLSWSIDDLAAIEARAVELERDERVIAILPVAGFRALLAAGRRVTRAANESGEVMTPHFLLEPGYAPNAFAIDKGDQPVISVTFGMVALLEDDEGMWATLLGHELAHLKLKHGKRRKERHETGSVVTDVMTAVLGLIGIPLVPLLADTATTAVTLGFSRDDEREADALAVDYLRRAAYDPADALRFHELLAGHSGGKSGGLFSTHPGGAERVEAIRKLVRPPAE